MAKGKKGEEKPVGLNDLPASLNALGHPVALGIIQVLNESGEQGKRKTKRKKK